MIVVPKPEPVFEDEEFERTEALSLPDPEDPAFAIPQSVVHQIAPPPQPQAIPFVPTHGPLDYPFGQSQWHHGFLANGFQFHGGQFPPAHPQTPTDRRGLPGSNPYGAQDGLFGHPNEFRMQGPVPGVDWANFPTAATMQSTPLVMPSSQKQVKRPRITKEQKRVALKYMEGVDFDVVKRLGVADVIKRMKAAGETDIPADYSMEGLWTREKLKRNTQCNH